MSARVLLLVALALIAPIEWATLYSRLPGYLATNFGADGLPGGWMTRPAASLAMNLMVVGTAVLFMALPLVVRKTPTRWLNVPRRDYWLAPERAAATRAWLDRSVWLMGLLTLVFLLAVNHLVLVANLAPEPRLSDAFLPLFVVYMVLVVVWTVQMFLRFRRV